MFTKNIKTIVIVAVALVVAILVSCLIAVNNDKKNAGAVADLNATIENLKDTIKDLEDGLADAKDLAAAQEKVIEALEANGVKLDKWDEATAVVLEKIEALVEVAETFSASYDENELGLTFDDVYGEAYVQETLTPVLTQKAIDIARATSVESMDAIIAEFQTVVDELPTRLERLYTDIEAIKADGVTYAEKEALADAYDAFYALNGNVFAPATETEPGEKETLYNTLNELYVEWRDALVAEFVAKVNEIPGFYAILDTDAEVIDAAATMFNEIAPAYDTPMFGPETEAYEAVLETEDVAAAITTLTRAQDRLEAVKLIKERAEAVNALINEEFEIGANVASHDYVRGLEAAVKAWANGAVDATTSLVSLAVITNPEDERFNETIYNYVDHETINGLVAEYEAAVAEIASAFKTFIDAVDAVGEVTLDSKEALDTALEAYLTCLDTVEADKSIFDTLVDAEEGKGLDYYYAEYHALRVAYEELVAKETAKNDYIKSVNDALHALYTGCTDNEGTHTCGTLRTDIAHHEIDALEAMFVALRTTYGLDLTALNETYVGYYYAGRLVPYVNDANAAIDAGLALYVGHEKYAELEASAKTQKAAVAAVSAAGYEFWQFVEPTEEGAEGTWVKAEDAAIAKLVSYANAEWIDAQFQAVINNVEK